MCMETPRWEVFFFLANKIALTIIRAQTTSLLKLIFVRPSGRLTEVMLYTDILKYVHTEILYLKKNL